MINNFVKENGVFRSGDVGVFEGEKLIHAAPLANYVPQLIADLFEWLPIAYTGASARIL